MSGVTQQETSFAQGALFIVDNAGPCPPGMNMGDFHNMTIANHLKNHSYFVGKSRELVDVKRMRVKMNNLAGAPKTKDFYQPSSTETRVEAFFRLGSTPIQSLVLSRYNYDEANFSEADLPAYVESNVEAHNERPDPSLTEPADQKYQRRTNANTRRPQIQWARPRSIPYRCQTARNQQSAELWGKARRPAHAMTNPHLCREVRKRRSWLILRHRVGYSAHIMVAQHYHRPPLRRSSPNLMSMTLCPALLLAVQETYRILLSSGPAS